jgi:mannose-6-phosphate isomerase-like protein (cupin superfamily)
MRAEVTCRTQRLRRSRLVLLHVEKWARNIWSLGSEFLCVFGVMKQAANSRLLPQGDYETVGYVISGRAKLELEGQTLNLRAGDSWLVPAGAMHRYTIIEPFTAVEATAPPAEVHGRDEPQG